MAALLHFPATPAIFVCHGWETIDRITPHFPRILQYIAVDDTCADRLLTLDGVRPERISVLLNGVDLRSFRQREPLPPRPRRAIVFGNTAHELTFLPAVREACRRASIEVDVIGLYAGTDVPNPESILGGYDLAFAKAKCAMEAMACGLAVVLCSHSGVGGMVRSAEFDQLRRLNFGIRTMRKPVSAETLLSEVERYDANDAREVSNRIRQSASSDDLHAALLTVYASVIEEYAASGKPANPVEENSATSAFLHDLAVRERRLRANRTTLVRASERLLRMPIVGRAATRTIRWLARRR